MSLRATAEIFRTIKMRSIMDIPPHKVPQCLSGRHRLHRRALYQIRIFQERQDEEGESELRFWYYPPKVPTLSTDHFESFNRPSIYSFEI